MDQAIPNPNVNSPQVSTQGVYNPQLTSPQVYTPPYQQPIPQQPSKKRKIFKYLGIFLLIVGILFVLNVVKARHEYQKPRAWIIPQSLNSSLVKKQVLGQSVKDGVITIGDLVKTATASTKIKPEAIRVGNSYILSTGSDGQAQVSLPSGTYKVALVAIPGVDFTGVPSNISTAGDIYQFKIGLKDGSGKIKSIKSNRNSINNQGQTRVVITLFNDKNGDGKKDENEPSLSWVGVTVRLSTQ